MSTAQVTQPARPLSGVRVRAAAVPFELVAGIVVALGCVALAVLTWGAWGDLRSDTGYDWVAAERIASYWTLPYEDFPYWYGPLGVGLQAAAYEVFGVGVAGAFALGLGVAGAALGLTYGLARQLTEPLGAAAATLLAATAAFGAGNMNFVVPHALSAPLAIALSLLALLAAARVSAGAGRRWLVVAGACTGLIALTRPEFVAAVLAALGLWLTVRVLRVRGRDRGRALVDAALVLGPAAALTALSYGAVLSRVSVNELVTQNLLPTDLLDAGGRHVLRLSAPLTVSSFAELGARAALYAVGCAGLVGAAALVARGGRSRRIVLTALITGSALALAVLAANPEAVRSRLDLVFEWIPLGAAVAAVWLAWRAWRSPRERAWAARDQVALLCAAFLGVLAFKTYGAFDPHPNAANAQFAIYAMPFAALFLAWLHLVALPAGRPGPVAALGAGWLGILCAACLLLAAVDGRREDGRVHAARGTLAVPAAQAPAYQAAVDAVQARTEPGDAVLFAPQLAGLSALTGRQQAVAPISLLPGALATAAAERAAIRQMADVRLAVTDRRPLTEYGNGSFGSNFNRRLGAWLRADFRRVAVLRGSGPDAVTLDIWQRSAS